MKIEPCEINSVLNHCLHEILETKKETNVYLQLIFIVDTVTENHLKILRMRRGLS